MCRNKKKTIKNNNWNRNLIVENNLEAKICMTTFRLFFVSGTEDFFFRQGRKLKSTSKRKQDASIPQWNTKLDSTI